MNESLPCSCIILILFISNSIVSSAHNNLFYLSTILKIKRLKHLFPVTVSFDYVLSLHDRRSSLSSQCPATLLLTSSGSVLRQYSGDGSVARAGHRPCDGTSGRAI